VESVKCLNVALQISRGEISLRRGPPRFDEIFFFKPSLGIHFFNFIPKLFRRQFLRSACKILRGLKLNTREITLGAGENFEDFETHFCIK
jgi:hypothetical protein